MRPSVLDQHGVANRAARDELQEAAVVRRKWLLLSVAKVPPGPVGGSDHGLGFGQRRREWLLTDHVPPRLERCDGHLGMVRSRGRDDDEVEVGSRDERSPILHHGVDPVLCGEGYRPVLIASRDGRDGLANACQRAGVEVRNEASSDEPDADFSRQDGPAAAFDKTS